MEEGFLSTYLHEKSKSQNIEEFKVLTKEQAQIQIKLLQIIRLVIRAKETA